MFPIPQATTLSNSSICLTLTSNPQVNVTISATIRLDNEIYCIHNNRKWDYCPHGSSVNDLVLSVEKLARQQ